MWITLGANIALRIPLAYGLVALAARMGASQSTQQKMVFLSLLICWICGTIVTTILYKKGGWKKRQVHAIEQVP
jgi:Na+-driven multidrug efflux pump